MRETETGHQVVDKGPEADPREGWPPIRRAITDILEPTIWQEKKTAAVKYNRKKMVDNFEQTTERFTIAMHDNDLFEFINQTDSTPEGEERMKLIASALKNDLDDDISWTRLQQDFDSFQREKEKRRAA
ncbi:MAG: hypothetical protein A3J48_03500 [Candidatus Doudnabacteria bacterium RIFCSPHIGHO2_02_FULL_46_11]|uniref:Uncharacterized protein n=1 Tax=Candidatus Doudnabacteria bacterium RIFCSPHIGHO2_02_FULL_46_11 TaxID=1817832 RepID=A0A1F5P5E1_9BACT|nr:MAG: hypothetical protein A3J48_03500 [Candidatus Doudnabacteria bacterium RIFCSPHIGHO2_02_FULL_46_11]